MVRIKRGTISLKSRKSLLKKVKGYRWGRSKKERQAREALFHAASYAFAHRRKKKGDFRKLWTTRISAALRPHNLSYSALIHQLKQHDAHLNRKMLAQLAQQHQDVFDRVVKQVASSEAAKK
ncbi:MAG: 50S ribosomal protein L20 [Candidatus Kaiserbacteria bacterium]|nr:50S ribosomal protein L20 [Candidatus Kaiserbacteria bacterium]